MAPDDTGFLSPEAVIDAIARLSPDDKLKLANIEKKRRGGTGFGPGELIQEALLRVWEGERRCPRDVVPMAFVVQTLRSISSHERDRVAQLPKTDDGQEIPDAHHPSPEDELLEREFNDLLFKEFADDEEAQMVLMGWSEGLRGAALREATSLDQAALDYAAKRIRLKMRRLYPNGRPR